MESVHQKAFLVYSFRSSSFILHENGHLLDVLVGRLWEESLISGVGAVGVKMEDNLLSSS